MKQLVKFLMVSMATRPDEMQKKACRSAVGLLRLPLFAAVFSFFSVSPSSAAFGFSLPVFG
jgi:hypothetical protein